MTFQNPWMLLGALAALIPLLVHLFDRRRPRPHPFGAISFVLKSQRRTASRLKLKRLILYCLRTLILLALPLALARPEWAKDAAAASARGPAATSIVLDASLSMRWSDGQSLFERGREEARDALKDLLPEEPANVVVCGQNAAPPTSPTFDRRKLRAQIDDAQPTYGPADLSRCLELAARSLEESPIAAKRLVVVSDFTQASLRLESPPPTVAGPKGEPVRPEVVLRDVAEGKEALPNRAIVDLKIEPALQVGPRAFQFTFTVRSFSPEPAKDLEASLKVGEQVVAKGFLDLPAGGTAQKTLTHRFDQGGVHVGEVLVTHDALPEDDRRPFVVTVPKELRALVVNGAPNTVRYRDEAFFVEAALTAPGSPLRASIRDVDSAFREDFSQYDVLLLLNVPAPAPDQAARLAEWVDQGGGLFLSMGDNVDPDAYNQRLKAVLPRPLRLAKTAADPKDADAEARAARLADARAEHPVFAPFTGKAREGLMSSRFFRYMLLEAESATSEGAGSAVLATLEDGAPAVAVAQRGKGRVMLFTSTVDRDWSDFSIRTSFLPLMQRFCAYLAGSLEERDELKARVGETLALKWPGRLRVASPSGKDVPVEVQPNESVVVGPVLEPGLHRVEDENGAAVPALSFPALLDASESDLSRLKPEELAHHFGEETVRNAGTGEEQPHLPVWTWLIALATVAFFFEGLLLRK